jgi:hypothetical protein
MNNDFDFLVIDDVVGKMQQDRIEAQVMSQLWKYTAEIATGYLEKASPTLGFCHVLFTGGKPVSENFAYYINILFEGMDKAKIPFTALMRVQSFLHVPHQPSGKYDGPHVNVPGPHIVGLYYVNDSDGDTVLFNQTTDDIPFNTPYDESILTEYQRISPKKGRMLFFNGKKYHTSTSPTDKIRMIISFDFT